ncbi:MAG TPA: hypothetical protein VEI97_20545, partial [bacterium]|nr:hypothetical protein [bacterium]
MDALPYNEVEKNPLGFLGGAGAVWAGATPTGRDWVYDSFLGPQQEVNRHLPRLPGTGPQQFEPGVTGFRPLPRTLSEVGKNLWANRGLPLTQGLGAAAGLGLLEHGINEKAGWTPEESPVSLGMHLTAPAMAGPWLPFVAPALLTSALYDEYSGTAPGQAYFVEDQDPRMGQETTTLPMPGPDGDRFR